jgi:hypothetical protein
MPSKKRIGSKKFHFTLSSSILNYIATFLSVLDILYLTSVSPSLRKELPLLPLNLSLRCWDTLSLQSIPSFCNIKKLITMMHAEEDVFTLPFHILNSLDTLTLGRNLSFIGNNKYNMKKVNLNSLKECTKLTSLHLDSTIMLTDIRMLINCSRLTSLNLDNCSSCDDYTTLQACPELEVLIIERGYRVTSIKDLRYCTKLKKIILKSCTSLVDVSDLAQFNSLEVLVLDFATILRDISVLLRCTSLKTLILRNCPLLETILPTRSGLNITLFDCPHVCIE